jgi:hypothetical protein
MQDLEAVIAGSSAFDNVHVKSLTHCIELCLQCAASCTACADECLDEPDIAKLRRCIRLNMDCADICGLVARLLSRRGEPEMSTLRACLEAASSIGTAAAAECAKHGEDLEHCKLNAEMCLACARECDATLSMLCAVPSA